VSGGGSRTDVPDAGAPRGGAGERYLRSALAALEHALEAQRDAVRTAGAWVAEAVARDRLLFVTGSGHSHMLAEEVFYRAGGLVAVHPILDPSLMLHDAAVSGSRLERLPGIAEVRLQAAGVGPGDVLVVASNSGRNAYPIEAADVGRELGARVIALTSLPHARSVASRHASGRRLFEVADLVLDTGVPAGDAAVSLDGLDVRVGPLSTVVGAALLNAVVVEAVAALLAGGRRPEVFESANVDAEGAERVDLAAWSRRIPPLR
jgi:uncharacterized phosphosugar-binding protein